MTSNNCRQLLHRFCYWLRQSRPQPLLCRLPLGFELLLAASDPQAILAPSGRCVIERKPQKVEVLLRPLESSYRQYPRLFLRQFQRELPKPVL